MSRWLASITLILSLVPAPPAAAQGCQLQNGIAYGTYLDNQGVVQELLLDLRIPSGKVGPSPLLVWIHGGGWSGGARNMPSRAAALCERGYAVASIDYRLTGTAPWPAQGQDCKGALRWLRANAANFDIDPDRIGVWGSSAGGHLVAWLGAAGGVGTTTIGNSTMDLEGATGGNLDSSSRVQAVVDWYGPTDLLFMRMYPSGIDHDDPESPEGNLLDGAVPDNPERVALVNPVSFLSADDPPFLLMHGTVDDSVPFHQSELLYRALVNRGLAATFVPILDAGHGGPGFDTKDNLDKVYAFLDQSLLDLPDVRVSLTAGVASVAENGGGSVNFTLARTGSTAGPLTVGLTTGGTATTGQDYAAVPATVTIPAGAASTTFAVAIQNDGAVEGAETLQVITRPSPLHRQAAEATVATVTIQDDENPSGRPVVTLIATDLVASEAGLDAGRFRITRTGSTAAALTVNLRTTGTATQGTDFAALGTSVVLPASQSFVDLTVVPLSDPLLEVTETVLLALVPAAGYVVGAPGVAGVRLGELNQASTAPIVSVVAIDFAATEAGDPGAFLVSRTEATTATLDATVMPGGTATNGLDYGGLPLSVGFGTGVNRVTVALSPADDTAGESAETATLRARSGTGYLIGPTSAPVTITDDDLP
jgi:acetyl esterase/lipase